MKKLVGYLTPKLPDTAFTLELAHALFDAGMDSLELGIPFSDPVADGAIIESAGHRALANGFVFDDILAISEGLRGRDVLWMGYMNPFFHRGMQTVADEAKSHGVSALIIPDLPHEEAAAYAPLFRTNGIALIEFIAPTTPKERIKTLVQNAQKFIYLVAYAGITGQGASENLQETISAVREATDTNVFVGFGVNAQTAKERAANADGVIVGSAFVKTVLDDSLSGGEKLARICGEARAIKEIINS